MGACISRPQHVEQQAEPDRQAPEAAHVVQDDRQNNAVPAKDAPEDGLAYVPPGRPADEDVRLSILTGLGILDTPREDRFSSISSMMCKLFAVPIAARQWFKAAEGLGDVCETGRDVSFCGHTILPAVPQIMVIKDALEDVRFADNPLVVGGPKIRFYAGAPLVSSANGYRYGSLCIIDVKPRKDFSPEMYNMLAQFAELTVREIEKDKLALLQRMVRVERGLSVSSSASAEDSRRSSSQKDLPDVAWGLTRAVDCFFEGVMLLDASTPQWQLLYTNSACTAAIGVPRDEAVSQGFWDLFGGHDVGPSDFAEEVKAAEPFSVCVSLQSIYRQTPKGFNIDFRPAAAGQLSSGHVGVPADTQPGPSSRAAPMNGVSNSERDGASPHSPLFYFAIVQPHTARTTPNARRSLDRGSSEAAPSSRPTSPVPGVPSLNKAMPTAFTDVRLGPLIGRGAYGRVYRGSWNGNTVAVKVMETRERIADVSKGGLAGREEGSEHGGGGSRGFFEAVLSSTLSHPNIVHTYQYAVRPTVRAQGGAVPSWLWEQHTTAPAASGLARAHAAARPLNEVWVISEFCNRGPLLTAIERGAFLTQPSVQYGQPNLIAVLQTLQEIAAAMYYLHNHSILHGDLTGGNVLLTASDKDSRGFTAKVVDFGLSRVMTGSAELTTKTMGCAEYMPPELIKDGLLTKAADVYAFGVIIWELYVGRRAWEGLKPAEVLRRVAAHEMLDFPLQTPHRLKVLGERCMASDPATRPSFSEVLSEVNAILADTMSILQKFLQSANNAR